MEIVNLDDTKSSEQTLDLSTSKSLPGASNTSNLSNSSKSKPKKRKKILRGVSITILQSIYLIDSDKWIRYIGI